jgi:hypothetical protein
VFSGLRNFLDSINAEPGGSLDAENFCGLMVKFVGGASDLDRSRRRCASPRIAVLTTSSSLFRRYAPEQGTVGMGSGHANYLKLLTKNRKNTLI